MAIVLPARAAETSSATADRVLAVPDAPADSEVLSDDDSGESSGRAWFVISCLLLPVVWGVLVHFVFTRLRGEARTAGRSESNWPDYQI